MFNFGCKETAKEALWQTSDGILHRFMHTFHKNVQRLSNPKIMANFVVPKQTVRKNDIY